LCLFNLNTEFEAADTPTRRYADTDLSWLWLRRAMESVVYPSSSVFGFNESSMKLSATYPLKAAQDKVFAALVDPAFLQKCIDGCEKMEKTGEDSYAAHIKIGVAGIKGSYVGKIRILEQNPPESFTLQVEGKGAPGWVKGTAKFQISPKDEGSEVRCDSDGHVGGLVAAVGSRLVEAAGKKMLDEFFRKLGQQLDG
jgi:uncharacterized protein